MIFQIVKDVASLVQNCVKAKKYKISAKKYKISARKLPFSSYVHLTCKYINAR